MSEAQLRIEISAVADQARAEIEALKAQIDGLNKTTQSIALGEQMQRVGSQISNVGRSIMNTMVGLGSSIFEVSSNFETSMAELGKAANLTGDPLQSMGQDILELSRTIPIAATGLAEIATAGSKMGIGAKGLKEFTELTAQMSTAFDMTAEDAGNSVGKLAASFGMIDDGVLDVKRLTKFADNVNALGDSMAVTESEVLNFVQRASAMKDFGMGESDIAAFGASIIELGMAPEIAANAFTSFGGVLANATKATPKAQAAFEELGFSVEELQSRMQAGEGTAVMQEVFEAAAAKGPEALGIFNDIIGAGFDDELARIAGASEGIGKGFQFLGKEGSSVADSFETMSSTSAAKMQLMRNAFAELGIALGASGLTDAITGIAQALTKMAIGLAEAPAWVKNLAVGFGALTLGVGALLIPLGAFMQIVGTVMAAGGLTAIIANIKAAFVGLGAAIGVVGGLIIAAVAIWIWNIIYIIAKVREFGSVGAFLAEVWMGVKYTVVSVFQAILQTVISVLQGLWQAITGIFQNIVSTIQSVMTAVQSAMVSRWNAIKSAVVAAIQGMITSIRSTMAQIPSAISSSLSAAAGVVTGFIGSFRSAGVGLISALVAGIKSKIGEIKAAVSEALSAARALLPFSDAKEGPFSDLTYSGGQLMATIAKGVLGNAAAVPSAMSQVFVPAMAIAQPLIPAAQTMPMTQPFNSLAPAMGMTPPTPMNAQAAAGGTTTNNSSNSPITVNFQLTSGGDGQGIMAQIRANQGEIVRIIESATARRDRTRYSNA
jgi:TP901 family phage tail tape measure protein